MGAVKIGLEILHRGDQQDSAGVRLKADDHILCGDRAFKKGEVADPEVRSRKRNKIAGRDHVIIPDHAVLLKIDDLAAGIWIGAIKTIQHAPAQAERSLAVCFPDGFDRVGEGDGEIVGEGVEFIGVEPRRRLKKPFVFKHDRARRIDGGFRRFRGRFGGHGGLRSRLRRCGRRRRFGFGRRHCGRARRSGPAGAPRQQRRAQNGGQNDLAAFAFHGNNPPAPVFGTSILPRSGSFCPEQNRRPAKFYTPGRASLRLRTGYYIMAWPCI